MGDLAEDLAQPVLRRRGRPPKVRIPEISEELSELHELTHERPITTDVLLHVPIRIGRERPKYLGDLTTKGWVIDIHTDWEARVVWFYATAPTGKKSINWTPFENIMDGGCLMDSEEKSDG